MNKINKLIEELVDIRDVHIDHNKSHNAKVIDYIKQIKDPYCFKYKNTVVTLDFTGKCTLEDKIIELLSYRKNI